MPDTLLLQYFKNSDFSRFFDILNQLDLLEEKEPIPSTFYTHEVNKKITKENYINTKDRSNRTILMFTAFHNDKVATDLLIKNGANIHNTTQDSYTTLHLAALRGHTQIVELLIDKKAKIDALAKDSVTPLHLAALHGHTDTVKLLLTKSANIEAIVDKDLTTPLHLAVLRGHSGTVELLINQRANIDALAKNDFTALKIAQQNNHLTIVDIIKKREQKSFLFSRASQEKKLVTKKKGR